MTDSRSELEQLRFPRGVAIERHIPLVDKLVDAARRRRDVRGIERDDMVSEGYVALIEAVDAFDPTRGIEFVKYATHRIVFALLNFLHVETRHLGRFLSIDALVDDISDEPDVSTRDFVLDVEDATKEVRELCRQAVTLHVQEGCTKAEVARRLKVSERHAGRMIEHGLSDLRDALNEPGNAYYSDPEPLYGEPFNS